MDRLAAVAPKTLLFLQVSSRAACGRSKLTSMRYPIATQMFGSAPFVAICLVALTAGPWLPAANAQVIGGAKKAAPKPKEETPPPSPPEKPEPKSIPMPEIAARAEQLDRSLRDLSADLPGKDKLNEADTAIKMRTSLVNERQKTTDELLQSVASSLDLREEKSWWRSVQSDSTGSKEQTGRWANAAQAAVTQLGAQEQEWSATLEEVQNQPEFKPLLQSISDNLTRIRQLRDQALEILRSAVQLQLASTRQDQLAADMIARLNTQLVTQNRILDRDSLPLWQVKARRLLGENVSISSDRLTGLTGFAQDNPYQLAFLVVIFLVSLFGAFRIHHALSTIENPSPEFAPAYVLFQRWAALAVVPPLLYGCFLLPRAPASLVGLGVCVSLFPILRLVPVLSPRLKLPLYCAAGLYFLTVFFYLSASSPVARRGFSFSIDCLAVFTFTYLLRLRYKRKEASTHLLSGRGMMIVVVMLACAAVANLLGYVKLSQFLSLVAIYSTLTAIGIYTAYAVAITLLTSSASAPETRGLSFIQTHRASLLRWVPKLLKVALSLLWFSITLDLLGVEDQSVAFLKGALDAKIGGPATNTTAGAILGFFGILIFGYFVARALRAVLREDVLRRFEMERGVPELISSVFYYLLMMIIVILAINVGGLDLNKLTLFTGALGVGVGFGLQNVISNLTSGLILQFERPIHVNDVLELDGNVSGVVSQIGIRSSTLKTFQGADVVIPNSMLISGKVVNWTLTIPRRRVEMLVPTAYGSDPRIVMNELLEAATSHPHVMTDPKPDVFFKNFGDSSVDFELQFWVMQPNNWVRVKSDLALDVVRRFSLAGIHIPFPQRVLHIQNGETGEIPGVSLEDTSARVP
jgi:potassium-dependent mechanosensitive channel